MDYDDLAVALEQSINVFSRVKDLLEHAGENELNDSTIKLHIDMCIEDIQAAMN